jgi:hypothetical protein
MSNQARSRNDCGCPTLVAFFATGWESVPMLGCPTLSPVFGEGWELKVWDLLQPCVLGFGLLQYGDVRISIFPERKEVFVSGQRPSSRSVSIRRSRFI